jgi:hypothetical protein
MKTRYWLILLAIGGFIWFQANKESTVYYHDSSTDYTTQSASMQEDIIEETEHLEPQDDEIPERFKEMINYQNNSLSTGAMPYSYCFGSKNSCSSGCSKIKVQAPYGSDVLVTIKKNDVVFRHAYISSGGSFTFNLPNGSYQPFFYYGTGWNPNKFMKNTSCGELKGGFVKGETVGKDDSQYLSNNVLTYTLILQQNGNFSTTPSNKGEAF